MSSQNQAGSGSEQEWDAEIIDETETRNPRHALYLVKWLDIDPATGELWEPSWEAFDHLSDGLYKAWLANPNNPRNKIKSKKGKGKANAQPRISKSTSTTSNSRSITRSPSVTTRKPTSSTSTINAKKRKASEADLDNHEQYQNGFDSDEPLIHSPAKKKYDKLTTTMNGQYAKPSASASKRAKQDHDMELDPDDSYEPSQSLPDIPPPARRSTLKLKQLPSSAVKPHASTTSASTSSVSSSSPLHAPSEGARKSSQPTRHIISDDSESETSLNKKEKEKRVAKSSSNPVISSPQKPLFMPSSSSSSSRSESPSQNNDNDDDEVMEVKDSESESDNERAPVKPLPASSHARRSEHSSPDPDSPPIVKIMPKQYASKSISSAQKQKQKQLVPSSTISPPAGSNGNIGPPAKDKGKGKAKEIDNGPEGEYNSDSDDDERKRRPSGPSTTPQGKPRAPRISNPRPQPLTARPRPSVTAISNLNPKANPNPSLNRARAIPLPAVPPHNESSSPAREPAMDKGKLTEKQKHLSLKPMPRISSTPFREYHAKGREQQQKKNTNAAAGDESDAIQEFSSIDRSAGNGEEKISQVPSVEAPAPAPVPVPSTSKQVPPITASSSRPANSMSQGPRKGASASHRASTSPSVPSATPNTVLHPVPSVSPTTPIVPRSYHVESPPPSTADRAYTYGLDVVPNLGTYEEDEREEISTQELMQALNRMDNRDQSEDEIEETSPEQSQSQQELGASPLRNTVNTRVLNDTTISHRVREEDESLEEPVRIRRDLDPRLSSSAPSHRPSKDHDGDEDLVTASETPTDEGDAMVVDSLVDINKEDSIPGPEDFDARNPHADSQSQSQPGVNPDDSVSFFPETPQVQSSAASKGGAQALPNLRSSPSVPYSTPPPPGAQSPPNSSQLYRTLPPSSRRPPAPLSSAILSSNTNRVGANSSQGQSQDSDSEIAALYAQLEVERQEKEQLKNEAKEYQDELAALLRSREKQLKDIEFWKGQCDAVKKLAAPKVYKSRKSEPARGAAAGAGGDGDQDIAQTVAQLDAARSEAANLRLALEKICAPVTESGASLARLNENYDAILAKLSVARAPDDSVNAGDVTIDSSGSMTQSQDSLAALEETVPFLRDLHPSNLVSVLQARISQLDKLTAKVSGAITQALDSAEKRVEMATKDYEYQLNMYREASSRAAGLGNELRELQRERDSAMRSAKEGVAQAKLYFATLQVDLEARVQQVETEAALQKRRYAQLDARAAHYSKLEDELKKREVLEDHREKVQKWGSEMQEMAEMIGESDADIEEDFVKILDLIRERLHDDERARRVLGDRLDVDFEDLRDAELYDDVVLAKLDEPEKLKAQQKLELEPLKELGIPVDDLPLNSLVAEILARFRAMEKPVSRATQPRASFLAPSTPSMFDEVSMIVEPSSTPPGRMNASPLLGAGDDDMEIRSQVDDAPQERQKTPAGDFMAEFMLFPEESPVQSKLPTSSQIQSDESPEIHDDETPPVVPESPSIIPPTPTIDPLPETNATPSIVQRDPTPEPNESQPSTDTPPVSSSSAIVQDDESSASGLYFHCQCKTREGGDCSMIYVSLEDLRLHCHKEHVYPEAA